MNSLTSLFVLVLASCMVFMSAGVPCTPATCPPGPVSATFQYSNCTGEVVYDSELSEAAAAFECQTSLSTSSIWTYDSTGMYIYNDINNLDCDLTSPNASYVRVDLIFGVCVAELARMYLPSVNSSFVSPQEPQALGNPKNLTAYSIGTLPCYGPHNCTREDGTTPEIIETTYSQAGNCSTGVYSVYSTTQIGVCYYLSGTLYVSPSCTTDHGHGYSIFVDDNCQRRLQSQAVVAACSNTQSEVGYQCTSPIAPVTPPPPSSSSASLSLSIAPLAVILAFILVFV